MPEILAILAEFGSFGTYSAKVPKNQPDSIESLLETVKDDIAEENSGSCMGYMKLMSTG